MFGFGSRNPQMRYMRFALLAVVLIAGATFHHTGAVYTTIRVIYYAVIFGGLGYYLWRRSVAKHDPNAPAPGYGAPAPTVPAPTVPAPAVPAPAVPAPAVPAPAVPAPTVPAPALPGPALPGAGPTVPGHPAPPLPTAFLTPGWYPDQQDMNVQRYWDGSAWTSARHWAGTEWVDS
jgi:hypothetical protein